MDACTFTGNTHPANGNDGRVYLAYPKATINGSKFQDAVPAGKHTIVVASGALTLTNSAFKAANLATAVSAAATGLTQSGNLFGQ